MLCLKIDNIDFITKAQSAITDSIKQNIHNLHKNFKIRVLLKLTKIIHWLK